MLKSASSVQFFKFGIIGVCNTFVHAFIVILLVENTVCNQVIANIAAFFCANIASFFLNCKFTFEVMPSFKFYIKFFLASILSLILTVVFSSISQIFNFHYLVGLVFVIFIVPIFTFAIQKKWTFKKV